MTKVEVIKSNNQISKSGESIPPRVDEFLQRLAQWTVEEMHFKAAQGTENFKIEGDSYE